jgi:quinone-modifying oxidoreductase subunit QmoC
MASLEITRPDIQFIKELRSAGGDDVNKCYQCATCSTICNLSPVDHPFPRKEMLMAQWGQADRLVYDPDVFLCYQCNDCTTYCPRGARPGDVLAAVRSSVYRRASFPSFMGRALASPAALPWLFIVPALVLLACIFAFAPQTAGSYDFLTSSVIDYNIFLPHSAVDALFVFGNVLIFILAIIGFTRFWRGLQANGHEKKLPFVSALVKTIVEIISHSRFNKCEANKPRSVGHMLILFGFIGAMITTGCIFVFIFVPHYLELLGLAHWEAFFGLPIELPNPVKFLGAFSGLALMIGGILLILRRKSNRDQVGANGYADYLFLWVMFLVGLTGMLSWLVRLAGVPMLAYVSYFVHLLVVFFLLWYMPYSKFAHMFYRTMALVYAKQIGRETRG